MIDHSLLHPTMTDEILREGCALWQKYDVASACIKPYAVKMEKELLKSSNVKVGTLIGFPHGNSSKEIKVLEAEKACKDGAVEVDIVYKYRESIGKRLGLFRRRDE